MPTLHLLSDLHLALANPVRMTVFGDHWNGHEAKIAARWDRVVSADDVVLVPGDISWASTAEKARTDLAWLSERPGRIIMSMGNHDRWWRSPARMRTLLPPNCMSVHNEWSAFGPLLLGSVRGQTCPGDSFFDARCAERWPQQVAELARLLDALPAARAAHPGRSVVLMIHYPPWNDRGEPSELVDMIVDAGVRLCVTGHFHREREWRTAWNGERRGVSWVLGSADARDYTPIRLGSIGPDGIVLDEFPIPTGPAERPIRWDRPFDWDTPRDARGEAADGEARAHEQVPPIDEDP